MKRKFLVFLSASLLLCAPVSVYADEKDDRIAELETQVTELQSKVDELQSIIDGSSAASTNKDAYNINDTWIVDGQWKLTVKSVEETADRNEYSDKNPAAVYIITYEYENLGYEKEGWDGLFISLEDGIVDASGNMGYSYPGDITYYAQETPVGAKCTAQSCIGVDNPGDFKINFSTYDGNSNEQKAVFNVAVQ